MAKKQYSPATERVRRQIRKDARSIRDLKDSQETYEREALESSQRKDWASPEKWDEWEKLSSEASRLKKKADTHPFPMAALLQAAVREHGKWNVKKKGRGALLRKDAALKMLRNRRR